MRRQAAVAAVFTRGPWVRTPQQVVDSLEFAGKGLGRRVYQAAGSENHSDQRTGGVDSPVCGGISMLQITPQMRILVAVETVDFRKASTRWRSYAGPSSPPIHLQVACLCSAASGRHRSRLGVRRSRLLAGHQAVVERPFSLVAADSV